MRKDKVEAYVYNIHAVVPMLIEEDIKRMALRRDAADQLNAGVSVEELAAAAAMQKRNAGGSPAEVAAAAAWGAAAAQRERGASYEQVVNAAMEAARAANGSQDDATAAADMADMQCQNEGTFLVFSLVTERMQHVETSTAAVCNTKRRMFVKVGRACTVPPPLAVSSVRRSCAMR